MEQWYIVVLKKIYMPLINQQNYSTATYLLRFYTLSNVSYFSYLHFLFDVWLHLLANFQFPAWNKQLQKISKFICWHLNEDIYHCIKSYAGRCVAFTVHPCKCGLLVGRTYYYFVNSVNTSLWLVLLSMFMIRWRVSINELNLGIPP